MGATTEIVITGRMCVTHENEGQGATRFLLDTNQYGLFVIDDSFGRRKLFKLDGKKVKVHGYLRKDANGKEQMIEIKDLKLLESAQS